MPPPPPRIWLMYYCSHLPFRHCRQRPSFERINKKIDQILIQIAILDDQGRRFWKKYFFRQVRTLTMSLVCATVLALMSFSFSASTTCRGRTLRRRSTGSSARECRAISTRPSSTPPPPTTSASKSSWLVVRGPQHGFLTHHRTRTH